MSDIYLYDDVPVLRNILGIKDNKVLDLVEAEQSRANMMLLYEQGFEDFPLVVFAPFIGFSSEIFMSGPGSIGSSTLRRENGS